MNHLGGLKKPFLFIISYDLSSYEIIPLDQLPNDISYQINTNISSQNKNIDISLKPMEFNDYKQKFSSIQTEIRNGNTYLINLTAQTPIQTTVCMDQIFNNANARYKLKYKEKFVCFSPEQFCKIENNNIYTYPMKGTMDASIENARDILLADDKELAEHTMVVDLLRNDLSIKAKNVKVNRFRYIEEIDAGKKKLLQVSSEISGNLDKNWPFQIGDIIISMLPAGSITGTPKKKTMEIIESVEDYNRGFFTGIFGVFDGTSLDSAVMIRFIEKNSNGELVYKSGGGITCDSDPLKEYQEMLDKVYIP